MICPELARRKGGWTDSEPPTDRNELFEAFRRSPGEPARERGPLEGLREGALAWDDERRGGGCKGVIVLPDRGDLGAAEILGEAAPLLAIESCCRELVRSSSPEGLLWVCEARRSGMGALG